MIDPQDPIRGLQRLRKPPRPGATVPELQKDPLISVPPDVLSRHNARVLDPASAVQVAGQRPIRSTVYIGDTLIISPTADGRVRALLADAALGLGLVLADPTETRTAREQELRSCAGQSTSPAASRFFPSTVRLEPAPGHAASPDAWAVLQAFRALAGDDHELAKQVSLDHLLTALPHIAGSPVDATEDDALSSYGRPGWGGRLPVVWQGAPPARNPDFEGRRPVAAVLDTGCGWHSWFDGVVTRNVMLGTTPLGLQDPGDDPEASGVLLDPLEGELDPDSGHGTFISGLIRQSCPDADILAIRVMASDGAVAEHVLIDTLTLLAIRQEQGVPGDLIDVVSLSLGYYHEQAGDANTDQPLMVPLTALAGMGVAVVVAAGNDATTRQMFPAAFTPQAPDAPAPLTSDAVPLLSVGALNPDGTHALFSNAGDWVPNHRQGVNLVSTFPPFDGSLQPRNQVDSPWGVRAGFDRDDFVSGFGTWSGTSFAAPLLAGELLQALASGACGSLGDADPAAFVPRTWAAVTAATLLVAP